MKFTTAVILAASLELASSAAIRQDLDEEIMDSLLNNPFLLPRACTFSIKQTSA
jgi:hypothetical protein